MRLLFRGLGRCTESVDFLFFCCLEVLPKLIDLPYRNGSIYLMFRTVTTIMSRSRVVTRPEHVGVSSPCIRVAVVVSGEFAQESGYR